jgi:hypothetical protein
MVDRGAALVFTTSDDVPSLRERVAQLSVPGSLENAGSRFDNIQNGVRLVFEAQTSVAVPALQRNVSEHARQIAETCGLVLTAPTDWATDQQRRAESLARTARPTGRSEATPNTKAVEGKQKTSEADKSKGKPATPAAKSAPKPKSAPAEIPKPKDTSKPKEDKLPKEDGKKPPIPRLPGPQPVPLGDCSVERLPPFPGLADCLQRLFVTPYGCFLPDPSVQLACKRRQHFACRAEFSVRKR